MLKPTNHLLAPLLQEEPPVLCYPLIKGLEVTQERISDGSEDSRHEVPRIWCSKSPRVHSDSLTRTMISVSPSLQQLMWHLALRQENKCM